MIPILYNRDETKFTNNGIGRLSDCIRCVVTEERNGIYECEFDYPITGVHFDEISLGKIVACTHDDRHDIQPFVIYSRSVPDLNGIVTFNAHHISYRLCDVVVMPFSAGSVAAALEGIQTNSVNSNAFTFWTDKRTVATFNNAVPRLARNMLGGEENSILDIYGGGDYEFDRFTVRLYEDRGQDSGVEIRYSKNLINLSQQIDDGSSYNAVVPYWMSTEGEIVTLPEQMLVFSGREPQIAYLTDHNLIIIRTETDEPIEVAYTIADAAPMNLSDAFEERPTEEQLRAAATARFERSGAWLPNENLTVDFVQLWQTEEFKEYSALQRVSLCDTVSVYYSQAGISKVKQKVIKVVYNVLLDRYDSIELGALQTSLGQAIQAQIMENVPTSSMMQAAIQYATDLIRGGLGGYVVMTPGPNGYPQEILIMDTPDTETAVNVWRFNQGGLGHSHNGYQGPFDDIALTQDGRINASMITTGSLTANLIRAGIITDASGKNSWNLDSGQFVTKQGTIANMTVDSTGLLYDSTIASVLSNKFRIRYGKLSVRNLMNTESKGIDIDGTTGIKFYADSGWPSDAWDGMTSVGYIAPAPSGYTGFTLHSSGSNYMILDDDSTLFLEKVYCYGGLTVVSGTKSRLAKTDNYQDRLLYCYETPTPLFGDVGKAQLDEEGLCYVDIDDIFSETIASKVEYQVFLQKEGPGDCWVAEKDPRYFVIQGTPGLRVSWELKAKQRDYEMIRLEQPETGLEEYKHVNDSDLMSSYISEQEELLYG